MEEKEVFGIFTVSYDQDCQQVLDCEGLAFDDKEDAEAYCKEKSGPYCKYVYEEITLYSRK